jgi:exonuclease VII large subunit
MGLMNSIKSTLFGGTQKVNTLTPEQKALLSQMGGLQQLNQQLANTQHSSMLHTSANRYAQDQLKQNTMNNINNLSYQNQLQQQQLKQQAQDSAYNRQLSSLAQLMGGNQTVLGTQANAIQKTGGLLDILSAAGSVGQGVGAIMKGV